MKSTRFFKFISIALSLLLVLSLFPTQTLADDNAQKDNQLPVYTVNFVDWDGTPISTVKVEEGSDATAPAHPDREGYVSAGWDIGFTKVMSDLKVTAQYTLAKNDKQDNRLPIYTVNFVDWDGSLISSVPVAEGSDATAPTHPDRKGYVPAGWDIGFTKVMSDLTVTAQYTEVVPMLMAVAPVINNNNTVHIYIYVGNGTSNLLQHFTMNPVTYANIGIYSGMTNRTLVNRLQADTGYALAGKSSNISNSELTGNGTISLESTSDPAVFNVYFHLKDNIDVDYTVRYVDEAGNSLRSSIHDSGKVGDTLTQSAPTISGYTLISNSPQSIKLNFSSNVMTFVYTRSYTITYNLNGGTNNSANPATYTKLTPTFTLAAPTKTGYTFAGWSPADTTIELGSTGNLTFTASWTLTTYTITYVLAGGINSPSNPSSYTIGSLKITLSNPTRTGYTFLNWSPTDTIPAGSTGDKTFTASWSAPLSYTITYVMNGGTNNVANPASYTVLNTPITLAVPTRTGYTFSGWSDGGLIPSGSTGAKSFTATWTITNYNITYDLAGGINNPSNPFAYTISSPKITLGNPTRAGYTFLNWSPSNTILAGSTGDKSFTASWSAPLSYNITYVMNGGTNNAANPATYTVADGTITLAAPTRNGYTFNGWSDSGVIPSGSTGNKTFTASWSAAIVYNITYNMAGGTNASANPATYTVESSTITLAAPTREGYNFLGWDPSGSILAGSTGDKAFTAVWSAAIAYNITYNTAGGVNDSTNPATYTIESADITLAAPTRDGYTFLGWDPTGFIANGSTGDKSFTATWSTAIDYIITYNMAGGVNASTNPATYNIESADITLAAPTRDGYNFLGWDPTGFIANGSTGDKAFTATWSAAVVYNITYNLAGGVNDSTNPATYTIESGTITLAAPSRTGYNFLGWNPTGSVPAGSTGDKAFTATWSAAVVYNITYNLAGGVNASSNPSTYTIESAAITLAAPTRSGYNFVGWNPGGGVPAGSTGNKSFTAEWSAAIVYNITYNLGGGTNNPSNPATYTIESAAIALAAPTRTGYNFLSWNPAGNIAAGSTGNKTFTARWSAPIRYSISYTLNGGTNNLLNPSSYTITSPAITLRDPVRLGYDFAGWTPTNSIPTGSTGDKSFAATWTPKTYAIHYDLSGGINDPANPASFTTETPTISLANPTRAGYNFWFWFPLDNIPQGSIGDRYVWAVWTAPINYSITYNLNGGTNNPSNPSMYNVNSALITLGNPTRDGYTFAGWSPSDSIGSGSTGDRSFTASWTPISYSITYDLAGGANDAANPATYTIESPTFSLVNPTRDYYTFAGWTPAGTTIEQGSMGDLTFKASWTPITYSITYALAGGANAPTNPASYTVETPDFTLANPTRAGYNFVGWSPDTTTVALGSHGDLSYTAIWSDPIVYQITYAMGGGVNAVTNPATYTVESAPITLTAPTRVGYDFLAWTPASTIPTGSTGNKVFTATWSAPLVYGITYVMNGGVNAGANPATYTIESATINLAAPTRAGYNFTGWTPAANIPTGSTGARTFTATWSAPIVYDITYVMGGGINAGANPATYTVVSGLITLADPTRVGYDFRGWTPTDTIPAASTGARTFTATWSQPHVHTVTYYVSGGTQAGLDGATPYAVYNNVAYGAVVPVPNNPAQNEFTFDGWTSTIPVTMPDTDVVLYGSMTRMPVLQEIVANEKTPLAGPTWSLLNLILTALTALGIGSFISMLQKKRNNKGTTKNTAFSISTFLPAAGAILAFVLTQAMSSGSMVFADRWSYLFGGIALLQGAIVALGNFGGVKKL